MPLLLPSGDNVICIATLGQGIYIGNVCTRQRPAPPCPSPISSPTMVSFVYLPSTYGYKVLQLFNDDARNRVGCIMYTHLHNEKCDPASPSSSPSPASRSTANVTTAASKLTTVYLAEAKPALAKAIITSQSAPAPKSEPEPASERALWRVLKMNCPHRSIYWELSVFLDGSWHWKLPVTPYIVAFNVETEKFWYPTPPPEVAVGLNVNLKIFGEELWIINYENGCFSMWVLKKGGMSPMWVLQHKFKINLPNVDAFTVLDIEEEGVLIQTETGVLCNINLKTGEMTAKYQISSESTIQFCRLRVKPVAWVHQESNKACTQAFNPQ